MSDVCLICNQNKATKTNSHIVPSFLITSFSSYNSSGKRDSEVLFTITNSIDSVYTGRSVPDTKIEELFDKDTLTQERIDEELSKNSVAKDFVFCPQCEKRLSVFLESPYAHFINQQIKIENDIPLFFWISVVWRMSVTEDYGFSLGDKLNQILQLSLKSYFELKENGGSLETILSAVPFRYKILRCHDYCKTESGFLFAQYKNKVLDVVIGEFVLRVFFELHEDFPNHPFFGTESFFANAPINHGELAEQEVNIDTDSYKVMNKEFVKFAAHSKRIEVERKLDLIWREIGQLGQMPIQLKALFFKNYYNEDVKIGDRHDKKRFAEVLTPILAEYFGIKE